MIRRPPLQSVRFDFVGSSACDPATGSTAFGVAAALTSCTLSRCAGSRCAGGGAGLKVESSLFHSGRSEDFDDAMAISGHCTTAKLRMTSHRPMIYPPVAHRFWHTSAFATILADYRKSDAAAMGIGLDRGVFWMSAARDTRQTRPSEDGQMTRLTK